VTLVITLMQNTFQLRLCDNVLLIKIIFIGLRSHVNVPTLYPALLQQFDCRLTGIIQRDKQFRSPTLVINADRKYHLYNPNVLKIPAHCRLLTLCLNCTDTYIRCICNRHNLSTQNLPLNSSRPFRCSLS